MSEKRTASFLFEQERNKLRRSFSAMVKVVGPVCNLDCDYCYYLEKDALYPGKKFNLSAFGMKEDILEKQKTIRFTDGFYSGVSDGSRTHDL